MRTRSLAPALALSLAMLCGMGNAARAQTTHLRVGYSLISEFIPVFVAQDHGIFARHGIEAELIPIANSSNVPAAVQSRSVDIGGVNIAIFLQAIDGGLDLVALSGSSMISNHNAPIVYVTSPSWNYAGPHSVEGRSVAMPGIGSAVDVLFRNWAQAQGAKLGVIRFVEIPLPQIPDSLRSSTVDSAVLVEPFLTRALKGGQAQMGVRFTDTLPHPVIAILYGAERGWADAHKELVTAFRAAIADAVVDARAHTEEARAAIGHYIKLPPEALASLPEPTLTPTVTPDQVGWWVEQMHAQGFLQKAIDPARAIQP